MEALRNLYNLQYFSNIVPETPQGSADGLMDLVFTVEEQPTTDIQLGATFSGVTDPSQSPISGLIKWNDRNFLGYGNSLSIEANASADTQNGTIQYTQHWLFGLPLSGGFDFTVQHASGVAAMDNQAPWFNGDEQYAYPDGFNSYDEYYNASQIPPAEYLMNYEEWQFSFGFSTGYRFSTPLGNLSVGGGFRVGFIRNVYDSALFRPFDPELREGNNTWLPSNSIWISVCLDQRDIYYDPYKGLLRYSAFQFLRPASQQSGQGILHSVGYQTGMVRHGVQHSHHGKIQPQGGVRPPYRPFLPVSATGEAHARGGIDKQALHRRYVHRQGLDRGPVYQGTRPLGKLGGVPHPDFSGHPRHGPVLRRRRG